MNKKLTLKKYFLIFLGMGIQAFGLYNIHSVCEISEGGVIGLILLLDHFFGISPSISSLLINGALFVVGIYILGKQFLIDSTISILFFSLWYSFFENITGRLLPSLIDKPLLASILGAICIGVGVGFSVMHGAAPGGDDVIALVLYKKFKIKVSITYIISDLIILFLSLTYIPLERILYSILTVVISGQIIDLLHHKENHIH